MTLLIIGIIVALGFIYGIFYAVSYYRLLDILAKDNSFLFPSCRMERHAKYGIPVVWIVTSGPDRSSAKLSSDCKASLREINVWTRKDLKNIQGKIERAGPFGVTEMYGNAVYLEKGDSANYPDLTILYRGEREEKIDVGTMHRTISSDLFSVYPKMDDASSLKVEVSWSSGLGAVQPLPFTFNGQNFTLLKVLKDTTVLSPFSHAGWVVEKVESNTQSTEYSIVRIAPAIVLSASGDVNWIINKMVTR